MSGVSIDAGLGWSPSEKVQTVSMYRWDTGSLTWVKVSGGTTSGPDVNVTNFPASQPISGTVTANQGTAGVTRWLVDGSGVTQPVSGTFWQATQPVSIATMPTTPVTGTFFQATQPVSAVSLPLPSNAAQETGGNLATIATNTSGLATSANQVLQQTNLTTLATNPVLENGGNLVQILLCLQDIRKELKILNQTEQSIANLSDDLDVLRNDPYYNQ